MMVTLQSLMMHQLDVERTPSLRRSTVTVSTVRRAGDAAPALRAAQAGGVHEEGTGETQRQRAPEAEHCPACGDSSLNPL